VSTQTPNATEIARLNDEFRANPLMHSEGKLVFTPGIEAMPRARQWVLLDIVQKYSKFDGGNDPYGEHDFGDFEFKGEKFFWKIDYYDRNLEYHSDDPANPAVTTRVLTVMRADEY